MAKKEFKKRLSKAVKILIGQNDLLLPSANALYTPMRIGSRWTWMAFSEPDGIQVRRLTVSKGKPAAPDTTSDVCTAVLVQSEESTSDTLLNPWGKACLPGIPGGVWIDIETGGQRQRCMLTVAHVLLVLPVRKSPTKAELKKHRRRLGILKRVAAASADATLLPTKRGGSHEAIAKRIWKLAKPFLL